MGKLVGNYRVQEKRTSAGATETFVGYPVPLGCICKLGYMAVCDYSAANKQLVLGIRGTNGIDHYLKTSVGVTTYRADLSLTIEGELILLEGEQPIGIVVSAGSSEVCYFSAHGGLYAMEEAAVV